MLKKFKMPKELAIGDLKSKFKLEDLNLSIVGLNTIKGKVLAMAIIPVVAVLILSIIMINVLGNNARDYDLLVAMDEVKNIQKQNQVLSEEYYHTLDNSVWQRMNENLQVMNEKVQSLQNQASFAMKNEVKAVSENIKVSSELTT